MAKKSDSSKVDQEAANKASAGSGSDGKSKALGMALESIEKQYGKGAIMKLGESTHAKVETTPTGALSLDLALGGGIPRGRIVEIYGPESSGKTTLAIHAIANVQKTGGIAAIIDAEHAFDRFYAEKLGVGMPVFHLSNARSRWGSCNASGVIRLNWRLIQLPLALIDYVIAHELAHLFEMNHSRAFWEVVAKIYPEYRRAQRELKQIGKLMIWRSKDTVNFYRFIVQK